VKSSAYLCRYQISELDIQLWKEVVTSWWEMLWKQTARRFGIFLLDLPRDYAVVGKQQRSIHGAGYVERRTGFASQTRKFLRKTVFVINRATGPWFGTDDAYGNGWDWQGWACKQPCSFLEFTVRDWLIR
jgi:hypothetical protein